MKWCVVTTYCYSRSWCIFWKYLGEIDRLFVYTRYILVLLCTYYIVGMTVHFESGNVLLYNNYKAKHHHFKMYCHPHKVCYGWKWMCHFTESSYSTHRHHDDRRCSNATPIDRSEQQEKFDHLFPTRTNANATVDEQWPVKYEMTTQKDSSLTVSKCWNN